MVRIVTDTFSQKHEIVYYVMKNMNESTIRNEIQKCDRLANGTIWCTSSMIFLFSLYGDIVDSSVRWFDINGMGTYLEVTGGILSAILGLAIPLALSVIQMNQAKGKNTRLTADFISERVYRVQIVLLILNIGVVCFASVSAWKQRWFICIPLFIVSMYCFWRFIILVHRYIANIEEIYVERKKNHVREFFHERE